MLKKNRKEITEGLRERISKGKLLVGMGTGISTAAKLCDKSGVDLLTLYHSGELHRAGRSSLSGLLSYDDANAIVQELGDEILPGIKKTPLLTGVCGTDPFRVMEMFLGQLKEQGFNGVQNFPTVGVVDGRFRANLEETNMGYRMEVDMIRQAHELDLFTCPYVFDPEQGEAMTEAGADLLVIHLGLVTKLAMKNGTAPHTGGLLREDTEHPRKEPRRASGCHGDLLRQTDHGSGGCGLPPQKNSAGFRLLLHISRQAGRFRAQYGRAGQGIQGAG